MKMKQCPYCGSETGYKVVDTVRRELYFTFDDDGFGSSDDSNVYTGKIKRCFDCGKKIGSVSE